MTSGYKKLSDALMRCKVDACIYFDKDARLNCNHETYSKQDLRHTDPAACSHYKTEIELIQRNNDSWVMRCVRNGKETQYNGNHQACSKALGVRPVDVYGRAITIPSERTIEKIMFAPEDGKKPNQADKLIMLCLQQEPQFFHDQHQLAYARIKQNGVLVIRPLRSKQFRTWLASLLWKKEGRAPSTEAIRMALIVLEYASLYEGQKYQLYNRVAPSEDGVWIDMSDDKWRAIKVTANGWNIVEQPPILFKRYKHQMPMVEPKTEGNPWQLFNYFNIPEDDENDRLLMLVYVVTCLIPRIPHVILMPYGIQGSGKSWMFKTIRALVDPSTVEVLTLPRNERERVQQLDHHWCAFYDNITSLPSWISDTLCRASTGGGFTKRELYSDDSDIIYNFMRCVGTNGINIPAQRGDLLDRALLIHHNAIEKNKRKPEKQLLKEFNQCKAEILGGLLDVLSRAMCIYGGIKLDVYFRMADFTKWGCAVAVALGYKQEDFIRAYEEKVNLQIVEAAFQSPVATVLIDWLKSMKIENWENTPSRLFSALINHAKEISISTRQKAWPKAPSTLVRRLNELAPSLKALGYDVITGVKSGSTRKVLISAVPLVPVVQKSDLTSVGKDSRDDTLHTSQTLSAIPILKRWISTNKDSDSLVDAVDLAEQCRKLNLDPQKAVLKLKEEAAIFPVRQVDKFGVMI
ncbi:MAG: hypothetical protein NWE91_02775 [Candidatus Bathyarchaeota archaeon]|nr:hypothetical protein [Candidatus Bathyarchaeota archaeon]